MEPSPFLFILVGMCLPHTCIQDFYGKAIADIRITLALRNESERLSYTARTILPLSGQALAYKLASLRTRRSLCRSSSAHLLCLPVELSNQPSALLSLADLHQWSQLQRAQIFVPFSTNTDAQLRSLGNARTITVACANAFDADVTKRTSQLTEVTRKFCLQTPDQVSIAALVPVFVEANNVFRCVGSADTASFRAVRS